MPNSTTHFRYVTLVEFADTDMAGILHFSNFFRYMERAEHAFWRSIGLSVHETVDGQIVTWPRVHAECDYKSPLRFEDQVEVELEITEIRSKAVLFGFRFLRSGTSEPAATGKITAVCVSHERARGQMRAIEIPPHITAKLVAAQSN